MPQHILLQTYRGPERFFYDTFCNGNSITRAIAMKLGFVTEADFDKHNKTDYAPEWFEIVPGNHIIIEVLDGDHEDEYIFTIPPNRLPDPPVKLDDPRSGSALHRYLKEHCDYIQT